MLDVRLFVKQSYLSVEADQAFKCQEFSMYLNVKAAVNVCARVCVWL